MNSNRTLPLIDYDICECQGEIYREAAKAGYDIGSFSDAYLKSEFYGTSFDTVWSRFQVLGGFECLEAVLMEVSPSKIEDENVEFDRDVAYWMGYIYRQLYLTTGIKSAELAEMDEDRNI